ncbi:hypothetical protein HID58_009660 [Brassica napus]|uniref:Uncharacterized protein n=1 Tax=Brassica napus TaxID=3708 RepID=A0ABQ8DV08_BRANA|nr:hypothetical protein HID58_009660 [Brassica napus]
MRRLLVYGGDSCLRSDRGGAELGRRKSEAGTTASRSKPNDEMVARGFVSVLLLVDLDVYGSEFEWKEARVKRIRVLLVFLQSFSVVYGSDGVEATIRFSDEERVKVRAFSLDELLLQLGGSLDRGWSLSQPEFSWDWVAVKQNPEALVTGLLLCLPNPLQDCKALVSGH